MVKKNSFFIIGLFWLILIFGFIFIKEFTLRTGKEVLLKTALVDPRDLFRGDYVVLAYDIGTLNLDNILADRPGFSVKDRIYVSLDTKNEYAIPRKIYSGLPKNEALFIRGVVKNVNGRILNVEYGIESYFIPEGKGRRIERARGKNLGVKASVDKFGNAAIKMLLLDGKMFSFTDG